MATDETSAPPSWWTRATLTAGLTALCAVLVALSTFLSARAASNSDDNYAQANQALTDANFFFEQGVDSLVEELAADGVAVDRICLLAFIAEAADGECETDAELEELAANDPVLAAGFEAQAVADDAAATGLAESTKSVDYQAALVMFAIGLAMSAWAALAETGQRARAIFLVVAVVAVIAGLIRLATV